MERHLDSQSTSVAPSSRIVKSNLPSWNQSPLAVVSPKTSGPILGQEVIFTDTPCISRCRGCCIRLGHQRRRDQRHFHCECKMLMLEQSQTTWYSGRPRREQIENTAVHKDNPIICGLKRCQTLFSWVLWLTSGSLWESGPRNGRSLQPAVAALGR